MQPKLLAKQAFDLSRRIYASLPWGFRIADFFLKLASGIVDAFGRVVYAEFIKRGVTGMPDIGAESAAEWQGKLKALGTRAGDKLPRGYGREFGKKAWRIMLSKTRKPEMVEELMTWVIEKLLSQSETIRERVNLAEAEGFILTILKNKAKDEWRSQGRLKEEGLGEENEEGDFSGDFLDPHALHRLEQAYSKNWLEKILQEARSDLEKIHPDAPLYIDLSLQGYTLKEIVGDYRIGLPSMLPHVQKKPVTPQAWEHRTKVNILRVLQQHMGQPLTEKPV
jgi:DNA-directed RNA polymerase specialized sigma24 family protein